MSNVKTRSTVEPDTAAEDGLYIGDCIRPTSVLPSGEGAATLLAEPDFLEWERAALAER